MSTTAAKRLALWIQGALGGFIGGGAAAVTAGLTVPAIDPTGTFTMGTMKWFQLMASMFVVNGAVGTMLYLKQHPVPEIVQPDEPPKP